MATLFPAMFLGGDTGQWQIENILTVTGESLPFAKRLHVEGSLSGPKSATPVWTLRGCASHQRYTELPEKEQMVSVQPSLGRIEATRAAMIPIRKSEAWWDLAQDERRAIFESKSHHIAACMKYMPAVARRLYHSRDLGEPFDFVTWFEFAPQNASLFEDLLATLRATEEWRYVEREIDVRLIR